MTRHRFYVPEIDREAGAAELSEGQSRQVSRVLRLRQGETVSVFDGSGTEFEAVLASEQGRNWLLDLVEEHAPDREPGLLLTVGLSAIRNERFDLAIQKLTELGVAAIAPIAAERSVISYVDARIWEKRRARIQRIIVEAAEQSERTTLPTLHDPLTVSEFLDQFTGIETFALAERQSTNHISAIRPGGSRASLLVGPEGGWTMSERDLIQQQATEVSLGKLILRTETAAIAAASYALWSAEDGSRE